MSARRMTRRMVLAAGAIGAASTLLNVRAETPQRQLRVATVGAVNGPWHLGLLEFKKQVEKESNQKIRVSVFAGGQLGDNDQLFSALQLGTLDFNYCGLSAGLVLKGGSQLNILYVPYLFRSADACERIVNGDDFKGVYDSIAEASGVRVVAAWGKRSPHALQNTRRPIHDPSDVRGLRVRIPYYDILRATYSRLGAQPVPLGWLELYTALSRGTVDAQENGFDLSTPAKFYEVAKHWSATNQTYESVGWFTNERLWKSLPVDDKNLLETAAQRAGLITTKATASVDAQSLETLKSNGADYVVPDIPSFQKYLLDVHKQFDGSLWPLGKVERIRGLA